MQTQINQNRCRLGLSSVLLISPSVGNTHSITEFGNSYGNGQQHLLVMLDLPPHTRMHITVKRRTPDVDISQSTTVSGSTESCHNPSLNIKFERLTQRAF
ncbi:hypothetical protein GQ457_15G020880 [Hibiscus cannabinus]